MANYVKISTIGGYPPNEANPPHGQQAVDKMVEFWQGQLDQVLCDQPDLVVVPEACDRYVRHTLDQRKAYYEVRGDQMRDFFADVARKHDCHVAYSAARKASDDEWVNSTQIIGRKGQVLGIYDKNHTTVGESKDCGMRVGTEAPIIETDFGTVGCAICFDLNFDELRLKYAEAQPDLIVFCSMYHGGLMQAYWAYSCRAHFVGAIANDHCAIISPVGETIAQNSNYYNYATATINLDCRVCHLDENWPRFQAARDKYGPAVRASTPSHLACMMIASESDEFSIDEIITEFEIELLDDYFERSLEVHHDPRWRKGDGVV